MNLSTPLLTCDIIIPEADLIANNRDLDSVYGIMIANKNELLMRTSLRELLKERENMLRARGFKLPEDWDLSWNFKLGPIWTPAELSGGVFWILPEYYLKEPDGSCTTDGNISTATDRYENHDFTQTTCDDMPALTTHLNGFQGLALTDNEYLSATSVGIGDGANGMVAACMINQGPDENAISFVFAGDTDSANDVSFWKYTSSARENWIFEHHNGSAENSGGWVANEDAMFVMGREAGGNGLSLRKDGGTADTGTTSGTISDQTVYIGSNTGPANEYNGEIFEVVYAVTGFTTALAQKLEGYFAHKYDVTSTLPAAHPYKINPPRADST